MSAEIFIKNEAKNRLRGKWIESIVGMLVLLFMPMITLLFVMTAYGIIDDVEDFGDIFTTEPMKGVFFVALHLLAVASLILLSPLYPGFARLYSKAAAGEDTQLSDMFYFYDNKHLYKTALSFMSGLLVKGAAIFMACELPALMTLLASDSSEAITTIGYILAFIGAVGAFAIVHRFAFSVMLFSYYNYDHSAAVKTGAAVARASVSKLLKLSVTFIPWMLLTFFVVPFLYIFPYMTCSYFVSLKYLITDYRRTAEINSAPIADEIIANKEITNIVDEKTDNALDESVNKNADGSTDKNTDNSDNDPASDGIAEERPASESNDDMPAVDTE